MRMGKALVQALCRRLYKEKKLQVSKGHTGYNDGKDAMSDLHEIVVFAICVFVRRGHAKETVPFNTIRINSKLNGTNASVLLRRGRRCTLLCIVVCRGIEKATGAGLKRSPPARSRQNPNSKDGMRCTVVQRVGCVRHTS